MTVEWTSDENASRLDPMKKPEYAKVETGHRSHMTGGGIHADRRTKRQRSRAAQRSAAIRQEW